MTCVPAAIVNTIMPPIYFLACGRPRNDLERLQSTYSPTVLTGRESVANVGVVWMGPIKLVVKQDSVSTEDIR